MHICVWEDVRLGSLKWLLWCVSQLSGPRSHAFSPESPQVHLWGGCSIWLPDGGQQASILSSLRSYHQRGGCNVGTGRLQHPLFTDNGRRCQYFHSHFSASQADWRTQSRPEGKSLWTLKSYVTAFSCSTWRLSPGDLQGIRGKRGWDSASQNHAPLISVLKHMVGFPPTAVLLCYRPRCGHRGPSRRSSSIQDCQFSSVTQSCPTFCDPMDAIQDIPCRLNIVVLY